MSLSKNDLIVALLVTLYAMLGAFGEDLARSIAVAVSGNVTILTHDIWAVNVLAVFVLSSIYVQMSQNTETTRNQLITFFASFLLVVGIALGTSRYVTLYFAFVVYSFFFIPILCYAGEADDTSSGLAADRRVTSFLSFVIVATFIAVCLGFIWQLIGRLAVEDMSAFGVTPPGSAILFYEFLIANGHRLTGLAVSCAGIGEQRWKHLVYGFGAFVNGIYGLIWVPNTISFKHFGAFVISLTGEDGAMIVPLTAFVLIAAFSLAVFATFEGVWRQIRAREGSDVSVLISFEQLQVGDYLRLILLGVSLGLILAILSLLGIGQVPSHQHGQVYRQIHLLWIHGMIPLILVASLAIARRLGGRFLCSRASS